MQAIPNLLTMRSPGVPPRCFLHVLARAQFLSITKMDKLAHVGHRTSLTGVDAPHPMVTAAVGGSCAPSQQHSEPYHHQVQECINTDASFAPFMLRRCGLCTTRYCAHPELAPTPPTADGHLGPWDPRYLQMHPRRVHLQSSREGHHSIAARGSRLAGLRGSPRLAVQPLPGSTAHCRGRSSSYGALPLGSSSKCRTSGQVSWHELETSSKS